MCRHNFWHFLSKKCTEAQTWTIWVYTILCLYARVHNLALQCELCVNCVWTVCEPGISTTNYIDIQSAEVTQEHQLTAQRDSPSYSQVSILPVHVVCATARIIAQPYADILDAGRSLLRNLNEYFIGNNQHTTKPPEKSIRCVLCDGHMFTVKLWFHPHISRRVCAMLLYVESCVLRSCYYYKDRVKFTCWNQSSSPRMRLFLSSLVGPTFVRLPWEQDLWAKHVCAMKTTQKSGWSNRCLGARRLQLEKVATTLVQ